MLNGTAQYLPLIFAVSSVDGMNSLWRAWIVGDTSLSHPCEANSAVQITSIPSTSHSDDLACSRWVSWVRCWSADVGSSSSDGGGGSACTPKGGTSSGSATQVVKINSDPNTVGKYEPAAVTVTKGQTVEWDWVDNGAQHSVSSDDNTTFDSGLCSAGAKFFVTFNSAGDFKYHCSIHAAMTADVKVS